MKITLDQWTRYSASNSKRRKKSATLSAIHKHVITLRAERRARSMRPSIMPASLRLKQARQNEKLRAKIESDLALKAAQQRKENDINKTLKSAAREARKMGFQVRSSKDSAGRVSSYYCTKDNARPIRISDHELPMTEKRQLMRNEHGGISPFACEIIIDEAMTATRIRRMIVLAEKGRI